MQVTENSPMMDFIKQQIADNDIIMFVKGSSENPSCGFSRRAMQIVDSLGAQCKYIDVLSDPELREGIKAYTDWPTLPQLYVKQQFIGGCDIISELHHKGELSKVLNCGNY